MKKYTTKIVKPNHFIFPALSYNLNLDDPRAVDLAISRETALFNKNLKILAERAKIEKNISSHMARHTFATRALRKGINVEVVSKIMAHSNIKQTLEYAKIVKLEMDNAMDKFDE